MIYNVESLDRSISAVIRNLGLGQDEIPYTDFVEWIADALEYIGSYAQYEEKQCYIIIENHEGMLPLNFHKMVRMKNACQLVPGDGTYWGSSLAGILTEAGLDWDTLPALEKFRLSTQGLNNNSLNYNGLVGHLNKNKNLIGTINDNKFTESDYNINLNRITTSFECGIIQLQYLANPCDERGFPMVPDSVSFRDAIYWKIAYHMAMRSPKSLPNPQMQDIAFCKGQWDWYCGQARAEANMPDLDSTIMMKNNFLRLVKDPHLDRTWFSSMGKQDTDLVDRRNS